MKKERLSFKWFSKVPSLFYESRRDVIEINSLSKKQSFQIQLVHTEIARSASVPLSHIKVVLQTEIAVKPSDIVRKPMFVGQCDVSLQPKNQTLSKVS